MKVEQNFSLTMLKRRLLRRSKTERQKNIDYQILIETIKTTENV